VPQHVEGLSDVVRNPIHATGVGLLLYGRDALQAKHTRARRAPGALRRVLAWFQGNF
jgi:cell division protein FtsA